MALNIIAFTVVKQLVQIFESDQEYFAVTADTDVNGQIFTKKAIFKKAALGIVGFFKWMNLIAAIVIWFTYTDR